MKLIVIGHSFQYEMENLSRMFFPGVKIEVIDFCNELLFGDYIVTKVEKDSYVCVKAIAFIDKKILEKQAFMDNNSDDRNVELFLARCLYYVLVSLTGIQLKWGILTGIRPTKLLQKFVDNTGDIVKAENVFKDEYLVTDDKIELCSRILTTQNAMLKSKTDKDFSLYVSIPFCPTRCKYCSFVSHSIENAKNLIPEYIDKLCEEIEHTSKIVKELGLCLKTVYIGGGTPTSIDVQSLEKILVTIENNFDLSKKNEYTVEAGRPDTITREKLEVIKANNVSRISINPQTMNDSVLKVIERPHTSEDIIDAYTLAREVGLENINMDLICGLETDTFESFCNTIEKIISLSPENITVHTLSAKRSSRLVESGEAKFQAENIEVMHMVEYAISSLTKAGYNPYYLYRQKHTIGNLENTGWSKRGYEGYYNVYIMNELHTIISLGAGGVTKLVNPHTMEVSRVYNYKFPYEYISNFSEILNRKQRIIEFYENI